MLNQSSGDRRKKIQRLEQLCREQGVPLTHQRRVVFEALADRKDHPTADQVYNDIRQRIPNVSRMTVYRAMEWLVRLGVLKKICHRGAVARFDPATERHHHLECLRCNRLFDLQHLDLDLTLPDTRRLGFRVADYSVHFTGMCAACERVMAGSRRPKKKATRKPSVRSRP